MKNLIRISAISVLCVALAGCGGNKDRKAAISNESAVKHEKTKNIQTTEYTVSALGKESKPLTDYISESVPDAKIKGNEKAYTIKISSQKGSQKIKDYINARLDSYKKIVSGFGKKQSYSYSGEGGIIAVSVNKANRKKVLPYINQGVGLLTVYRQVISAAPGIQVTVTDSDTSSVIRSTKVYTSSPFRY